MGRKLLVKLIILIMTLGKIKNPKIINIKAIKKYIFNNVSPPSKIINSAKIKKN